MNCPNCGAHVPAGTRWCTACGHDLMPELGEEGAGSPLLRAITERAKLVEHRVSASKDSMSIGTLGVVAVICLALAFRVDNLVISLVGRADNGAPRQVAGAVAQGLVALVALGCAALTWRASRLVHPSERLLAQLVVGVALLTAVMASITCLYWATLDLGSPFG